MHPSIEEDEVTAQRDAAVSLFKGLQERIRTQAAEYEARTEVAEMGRIEYEILLEQLQLEESGSAMTARAQVRTVTQGWAVGILLGWSAGLLMGCLFSPVLGFMIVLPFVAAGVMGGLIYAQLRDKMRSLRREKGRQMHGTPSMDKEEFLRQLQGRSDPSATGGQFGGDGSALPSGSFLRRVAMGAAQALVRSALDVTLTAVSSMMGFGGGGGGGGEGGGGGGRRGRDFGRTGAREG